MVGAITSFVCDFRATSNSPVIVEECDSGLVM